MRILRFVLGFSDNPVEKPDPHCMLIKVHLFYSGYMQNKSCYFNFYANIPCLQKPNLMLVTMERRNTS
jgi:hypothetical protein